MGAGKNKTLEVEEEIDGKDLIENNGAPFVEAEGDKYGEENNKDILHNKDSLNREGSQNSKMGLLEQSAAKTKLQDKIIEFKEVPLEENCESKVEDPTKFFS